MGLCLSPPSKCFSLTSHSVPWCAAGCLSSQQFTGFYDPLGHNTQLDATSSTSCSMIPVLFSHRGPFPPHYHFLCVCESGEGTWKRLPSCAVCLIHYRPRGGSEVWGEDRASSHYHSHIPALCGTPGMLGGSSSGKEAPRSQGKDKATLQNDPGLPGSQR